MGENVKYVITAVDRFSGVFGEIDRNIKKSEQTLKKFGQAGKVIMGMGVGLAGGLGVAVKQAMDFESYFAGVRKTVDATEEGFAELSDGIRGMAKELPASAVEIASVAESAGQLGIAEDHILSFSRTMIDLGEATNLTSEQAATSFARFANITQMPQTEFDKLGSSVVALGNTMATTESEIVDMSMRLAAQGKLVGMSEAQIMALSGTMSSLGIEAEAGGTAMTMVLKKIQNAVGEGSEGLEDFAKASGMSSEDFAAAWESDPIMALDAFIKGLGESGEEGENLNEILGELGITGIRESDAILRMAGASDLLSEAVDTSTTAWDENTALAEEAQQRYETTASQLAILKNVIVDTAISFGDALLPAIQRATDFLKDIAEWFNNLSDSTKTAIATITAITAALALVAGPVLILIGMLPTLIAGFKIVGTAIAAITSPIGLVVAAAIAATVLIIKNWEPISDFFIDLWDGIKDVGLAVWDTLLEVWQSTSEWFINIWQGVSEFFSELWEGITDIAINVWDGITEKWSEVVEFFTELFSPLVEFYTDLWANVTEVFSHAWETVTDVLETVWGNIQAGAAAAWDLIKNVILGPILLLIDLITGDMDGFEKDLIQIWDNIKDAASRIWDSLKESVRAIVDGLVSIVGNTLETFKGTIAGLWGAIKSTASNVWDTIRDSVVNLAGRLKDGAIKAWDTLKTKTSEAFNKVKDFIINPLEDIDLLQIGKDIINGLINGIGSMASAVWDKAKSIASGIGDAIKGTLGIKSPSRVTMQLGIDTGEGIDVGLAKMIDKIKDTSAKIAVAAIPDKQVISPKISSLWDKDNAVFSKPSIQISQEGNSELTDNNVRMDLESWLSSKISKKIEGVFL